MGGLISRYYAEVLEGWRNCHTLITIGSPHRGSPNAVEALSNGVHPLLSQLNNVIRSFESMYQILPTYPVVKDADQYKRLIELDAVPQVDLSRVRQARQAFLGAIVEKAPLNRRDPNYQMYTIPWLGTHQPTLQSAEWQAGRLKLSETLPTQVSDTPGGGDGTVPRLSAVPPDLDGKGMERFAIERHGWLTNNPMTLSPLLDTLVQLISGTASDFFGVTDQTLSGLSLQVEPVYQRTEPVTVRVQLVSDDERPQMVELTVTPKNQTGDRVVQTAQTNSLEQSEVTLGELPPGLYELAASAVGGDHPDASPVHGIFEVIDPALVE
jgi:hypothetical protein